MKHVKRFLSMLLAMVMVIAMAIPSMAAGTPTPPADTTIVIRNVIEGTKFDAWKILNASNSGTNFSYTINEKYRSILETVTGKTADADIVKYIEDLKNDAAASTAVRTFADAVYKEIKSADPALASDANTTVATGKTEAEFEDVDQGYYLIAQQAVASTTDTISLVMLDTKGEKYLSINTKSSAPEVEKKVQEKNDSLGTTGSLIPGHTGGERYTWQDAADYDLGDHVPFKLTATLPNNAEAYEKYTLVFEDKMEAGLTFDEKGDSGDDAQTKLDKSVTIKVGGEELDRDHYKVEKTSDGFKVSMVLKYKLENGTERQVNGFANSAAVTVEYTATLNENAVMGTTGNKNTVVLKYSNNPYFEGAGVPDKPDGSEGNPPETPDPSEPTGTTPEDTVIVFTYKLNVKKTDGTEPLSGAGFTLYKFDKSANSGAGDYVAVGSEIKDVTTFTFNRIDAGQYKLVETTVPSGYNKAADIVFTVYGSYTADLGAQAKAPTLARVEVFGTDGETVISTDDESKLSETIQFFIDSTDSKSINTTVVNKSGTELPETGGIGTTLFYVFGSIMVIVAGILLVTKKRMGRVA